MSSVMLVRAALSALLLASGNSLTGQTIALPNGVERTVPPVMPSPEGPLIVTAPRADVFVPADGYVLLKPPPVAGRPDVAIRTLYVLVADQLVEQRHLDPGESFGTFRIDPPTHGVSLKCVRIVGLDDFSQPVPLMACNIRSWQGGEHVSTQFSRDGEQVRFTLAPDAEISTAYLFLDDVSIGRLTAKGRTVTLDLRSLPPGDHRLRVVGVRDTGLLLPAITYPITIAPRFQVQALEPPGEIRVAKDDPNRTLAVNIKRAEGVGATSVLVYIAGQFISEHTRPEFVTELPLSDTPTGMVSVEVIGVGKDGFFYPAETLTVPIKNLPWEARVLTSAEYQIIEAKKTRIQRLEAEAIYWYARAFHTPSFRASNPSDEVEAVGVFRRDLRISYLDGLETPGSSREYNARAKQAVMEMAQTRLAAGRAYKSLRMWEWARSSFIRAAREAGNQTPTGEEALAELKALDEILKRR